MKGFVGVILVFMLIYNISFKIAPSVSSGRIAILILFILTMGQGHKKILEFGKEHSFYLLIYVTTVGYAFMAYYTSGRLDTLQLSRLLNFAIHTFFGAILYAIWLGKNESLFYRHMSIATAIQSALQIVSLFSPDYRFWVADILVQGGNNELTFAGRPPGFANSTGASFSIIQALGMFSILTCLQKVKSLLPAVGYSILAFLVVISTILSGRTGLILVAIIFAYFLITSKGYGRLVFIYTTVIIGTSIYFFGESAMNWLEEKDTAFQGNFRYISEMAFEFFMHGEVASVKDISSMPIPPMGFETILGTGLVEVMGKRVTGNDSGYIQSYYALGLGMSILFYLGFFGMNMRIAMKTSRRFGFIMLIVAMFIVEAKEPFIFKYIQGFFILTGMLLDPGNLPRVHTTGEATV